jgi:hypothetical protein
MNQDFLFNASILVSTAIHAVIAFNSPILKALPLPQKPASIQVVYLKNPPQMPQLPKPQMIRGQDLSKAPLKVRNPIKLPVSPNVEKGDFLVKDKPISFKEPAFKPSLVKPEMMQIKKKISLPPVELDKINNPSYVSYYHLIREQIRRAAYQNYTHAETGEIYLAFVVYSNGLLKEVKLIEDRSTSSFYLRDIALRSIREAAPFKAFPRELDYPQLSFNVIISFALE